MSGRVKKRLKEDYVAIMTANKVKWCHVELEDDNIRRWNAFIQGPEGSPYEGGTFHVTMNFEREHYHPEVMMKTFIFHVNVDTRGYICLKYVMDANYYDAKTDGALILLQEIYDLMKNPIPGKAINIQALSLYCEDKKAYDHTAKIYTEMRAINKKKDQNDDAFNNGDEKKDDDDDVDEEDDQGDENDKNEDNNENDNSKK